MSRNITENDIQELLIAVSEVCDNARFDDELNSYVVNIDVYDKLEQIEQRLAH